MTTAIEGAEIPGLEGTVAPRFRPGSAGYVNPDSTGVGRMLTLKVYALQATTGKILWERTSFEGPPVRRPPPLQHLRLVHDRDRREAALRVVRGRRVLRLRPCRRAEVED
ncbi:MAG: hypothetical protein MZU95_01155 [Desulfomicrobium escambiense]|nr:hypothetical protein [Desulfomicrobium escambiense]